MIIRNRRTGEVKEVSANQASNYGISPSQKPTEQPSLSFSKSLYNLMAKPVVEGAKSYGELMGAAGTGIGSGIARRVGKPELAESLAKKSLDIRQRTGIEGSFQEGVLPGLKTMGVGGLKTLGGVGAAASVGMPIQAGLAGGVGALGKGVAQQGVRSLLVNLGLYGAGGAAKAAREEKPIIPALLRGATGEETTGLATGVFGETPTTKAIDVALGVGLPVLFGKQIDKATGKIVTAPGKFARQVKSNITTSKVAQGIKSKSGEFLYKQGKDDVLGYLNPTKKMKADALKKDIDLADTVIARGLDDTPQNNLALVRKQEKIARSELIKLAKEKKVGIVVKKDLYQKIADELKNKSRSVAEKKALDKWAKDNAKSLTVSKALSEKKVAGAAAFTKTGNIKQNAIAKADGTLAMRIREILSKEDVLGEDAKNLLRSQEESILLDKIFANVLSSKKGTTLKTTLGRIFNPITAGKEIIGGLAEKATGKQKFGFRVAEKGREMQ